MTEHLDKNLGSEDVWAMLRRVVRIFRSCIAAITCSHTNGNGDNEVQAATVVQLGRRRHDAADISNNRQR